MKVVVVGCTHTGTAAIKEMQKNYNDIEISVYEANDNISFLSCGIALCVGNVVDDINKLFYSSPNELQESGVNVFMKHKVVEVDSKNKTIRALNLDTGEHVEDTYDKLVVSTGSWPINPKIENIELENILLSKNFEHANQIIEKASNAKRVAVVGAGYIGVELAEAFHELGKEVVLIDSLESVIAKYVDQDVSEQVNEILTEKGITLAMNQTVQKFIGNKKVEKIVTDKNTYDVDLVILCIGFRPNTELLKGQVETLDNGAIVVDEYMRTSDKDIFAGGDSITLDYLPDGSKSYIPLATNALRTGTIIGKNIKECKVKHPGTNATSSIKIFDYNISTTGLTLTEARKRGINAECVTVTDNHLLEFMEGSTPATLKVVYDVESRRVIGGQFITTSFLPQTINVISMIIHSNSTIDELPYLDFYFLPHFNKPWNIINLAGLAVEK